jgi:hypothetical protein
VPACVYGSTLPQRNGGAASGRLPLAPHRGPDAPAGCPSPAQVVDFDYRGPVGVILFNHSDVDFVGATRAGGHGCYRRVSQVLTTLSPPIPWGCSRFRTVKKGDRVAQLILEKITTPPVVEVCPSHGNATALHPRTGLMMPPCSCSHPATRWRTWTTPPVGQAGLAARE